MSTQKIMNKKLSQKFVKWQKLIERISYEVFSLNELRYVNLTVSPIINQNPKLKIKNRYWNFLFDCYATTIVINLRRQLKVDKKMESIGLATLLNDISNFPHELSRKVLKKVYHCEKRAERVFDNYVGINKDHITVEQVKNDIDKLDKAGYKVEDFADKRIAHIDNRKPKVIPTFNEVHNCIDEMNKIFKKYRILLQGVVDVSLIPMHQNDANWLDIFKIPWNSNV